ncbi:uncharacterized protein LOC126837635 [Adelges cooleyi]|uniref:uncharacterized protein LOC126837635 n=1 Tax=Adelges cooleyi TaxID=133065 RepID=UPI0021807EB1|nr:uncharacterized protein LOC126837635 [Adelges cooleyi]
MKHFCFLISFAVVTVLSVNIADYKIQMAKTNKKIELAGERMHRVIRKLVRGRTSMEIMAIMLAAPEVAIAKRGLWICKYYQTRFHKIITRVLGVLVPTYGGKIVLVPEHGVNSNYRFIY